MKERESEETKHSNEKLTSQCIRLNRHVGTQASQLRSAKNRRPWRHLLPVRNDWKKMAPKHAQTRHAFSAASLTRQAQTQKKKKNARHASKPHAPCKNSHATVRHQQKQCAQAGIEPGTAGLAPRCTCHYSYACFSFEMHPQTYLIWANMEDYPLIKHSLVCTILS